jgi:antirestriction protein
LSYATRTAPDEKAIGLASARPFLKAFKEGPRILAWHMSFNFQTEIGWPVSERSIIFKKELEMNKTTITPKIYVACLAAYNNGILHGSWIDASTGAEHIHEEIKTMLAASPIPHAEEWAIHDYEGFGGIRLSEYEDIEKVAELAAMIEEHGPAYIAYAQYAGMEDASEEDFQDKYAGEWDSEEDFAMSLADETMNIPENIQPYFNYEKFAGDLFINDYYSVDTEDHKVHVFRRY